MAMDNEKVWNAGVAQLGVVEIAAYTASRPI